MNVVAMLMVHVYNEPPLPSGPQLMLRGLAGSHPISSTARHKLPEAFLCLAALRANSFFLGSQRQA